MIGQSARAVPREPRLLLEEPLSGSAAQILFGASRQAQLSRPRIAI